MQWKTIILLPLFLTHEHFEPSLLHEGKLKKKKPQSHLPTFETRVKYLFCAMLNKLESRIQLNRVFELKFVFVFF